MQATSLQKETAPAANTKVYKKWDKKRFKENIPLLLMFTPILIFYLLFKYVPMFGLVIAFKNYNFADGIWGSPWTGLDNFKLIFNSEPTLNVIRNTLLLSGLSIIVGFPFPILLAILLNEVRKAVFKRVIQTIVYLPHFLNWVIVGGLIVLIFSQQSGTLNQWIERFTGSSYPFLYNEASWITIFVGSGIWKGAGWGAIIYLAALSAIDTSLYEAAGMDGAGKLKQIWYISLPSIRPTIVLLFILSMGNMMEVGFDQVYVLQNPAIQSVAEVISTWNYKVGLNGARFSLATAMGLFESLVGLIFVLGANSIARRYNQGLW
ncbi:sugar ABC transporter permease [Paenibacillus sp. FSL H7-0331]|uniref:ABC transporter permease n=2 Tax=Paenibacillus sp. FSL H7-0331 TaxID=1920421 RepID=UPI00096FDEBF|nr:protein lplB [Paenibacillus sp. FSL H7-0331]